MIENGKSKKILSRKSVKVVKQIRKRGRPKKSVSVNSSRRQKREISEGK